MKKFLSTMLAAVVAMAAGATDYTGTLTVDGTASQATVHVTNSGSNYTVAISSRLPRAVATTPLLSAMCHRSATLPSLLLALPKADSLALLPAKKSRLDKPTSCWLSTNMRWASTLTSFQTKETQQT